MTFLVSRRKHGFSSGPLHRKREPHPVHFLRQRGSFWIATLSVMAFIIGNMIGQHGWYMFMASVLGSQDDSLIVYTGTVSPLEKIPDYGRWSSFGGSSDLHTFRQVPQDVLVDLPLYDENAMRRTRNASTAASVYSVGHAGSYATGAENSGSHPGVDIRVPLGTPVRAMANGIVSEVKTGGGFGNVVVLRHPNVPDPGRPAKTTTLYSAYAHLQSFLVSEGDVVHKGEQIAYSGDSGNVTGPHLHFQIDRENAPFHPYWPFTDEEADRARLTIAQAVDEGLNSERLAEYTVNPMVYTQKNYPPASKQATMEVVEEEQLPAITREERISLRIQSRRSLHATDRPQEILVTRQAEGESPMASVSAAPKPAPAATAPVPRLSIAQRITQNREQRVQERFVRQRFADLQVSRSASTIVQRSEVASRENALETAFPETDVAGVSIQHDGQYGGRGWEKIAVQLTGADGVPIFQPILDRDIYLRTAYGEAEFRPAVLSSVDFVQGRAEVYMLPRGRRTVVIQAQPFQEVSLPMEYVRE